MILGLEYAFMRHAVFAGSAIALVSAPMGYFVLLRRQAFAAHALSHVGFAGAAGAILLSLSPYLGLFAFTLASAVGLALLGSRVGERDVGIGMVLMFALGLGVLFLNLYTANAAAAIGILFGSIVGISSTQMWLSAGVALGVLVVLALIYRPLRLASLDQDAARGRGVPVGALGVVFVLLLALAVSISVPVIGALLIFSLLIGPPAAARVLARSVEGGLLLAALIGLAETWGGIAASYYIGYPASTWIAGISFLIYLLAAWGGPRLRPRAAR
ncbi:MAG: metal ABC transporter permease [Betaproteobacteria bacterium]|nr:metal ABC transporter permease [Betaproteobacteria bacterium]